MARVTIEKYTDLIDCFRLVILAARRARDLGHGARSTLPKKTNDKNSVIALREIEQQTIS